MPAQLADFVLETATAPGTGSFILNGPEPDRRSFSAAFPNGGAVFYFADDGSQAEWGVGTLAVGTPSTLSRTTVVGTTGNSKSALNFSGTVEVYSEIPADFVLAREADGSVLVPAVTDWTKNQPVPAADAERAYVRRASSSLDYSPLNVGVNISSGKIWVNYLGADGKIVWVFAQPDGDYATNSAVSEGVNNLGRDIAGRVQKSGDVMSGDLALDNPQAASNVVGGYNVSAKLILGMSGRGVSAWARYEEVVGQTNQITFALPSFNNNNGQTTYFWLDGPTGRISSTAGRFALESQLPSSGPLNGGYFTRVAGVLTQYFTVTVSDNTVISYPMKLGGAPYHINIEVNNSIDCDHSYTNENETGFLVHLWQNGSITLKIMVVGPAP